MAQTFHITLRDIDRHEGFDAREFDIAVGSCFRIGRSSKNAAKPELAPAAHNAYINSPVISREHAELHVTNDTGIPRVYIKDVGSMHGTLVNGQKLITGVLKQLSSGDKLQFGVDVNRNEDFYAARRYAFTCRLVHQQSSYSQGISVPDSETEDLDVEPDMTPEHADVTIIADSFIPRRESSASLVEVPSESFTEPALLTAVKAEIAYEVDSDSPEYSTDHDNEEEIDDTDEESSSSEPNMDTTGSFGFKYDESEGDDVSMHADKGSIEDVPASQDFFVEPDTPFLARESSYGAEASFTQHTSAPLLSPAPALPSMIFKDNVDDEVVMDSNLPPLPPRQFTSPPWGSRVDRNQAAMDFVSSASSSWFSSRLPSVPDYMGTNYGDRPSLYSPAPAQTQDASAFQNAQASSFENDYPGLYAQSADRIPTPPFATSPEAVLAATPPPSRRTKVSITEIVEDQPPTPSSINALKRKADCIDDDEAIPSAQPAAQQDNESKTEEAREASVIITPEQLSSVIAQRPKKQPRSIVNRLKTTATYLGYSALGAVSAVVVLSNLPDTFFI